MGSHSLGPDPAYAMELNQTRDVGRLVDLGGPLYNGMWKINDPLFPPSN